MFFKDLNHEWKEISLERTLKNILGNINFKNYKNVEHVHNFGYYIGNYPTLKREKIIKICDFLNTINI